jgi:hypothetical protein
VAAASLEFEVSSRRVFLTQFSCSLTASAWRSFSLLIYELLLALLLDVQALQSLIVARLPFWIQHDERRRATLNVLDLL